MARHAAAISCGRDHDAPRRVAEAPLKSNRVSVYARVSLFAKIVIEILDKSNCCRVWALEHEWDLCGQLIGPITPITVIQAAAATAPHAAGDSLTRASATAPTSR